ncbi:MAG TPA: NADH:ubiquinone reductase (Na(+)-transporting) subunit C [Prolixibacteraceae bacterium]|nr:NADH:ubiquinone reductase (Na(+)-transporting) subunit C [Prolixibacteraceae bacterium]
MDTNGNRYTFIYASVMVVLVAAILSIAAIKLKPFQQKNIDIEKKQNILSSVGIESTFANAESIYAEKIVKSYLVNAAGDQIEGQAFDISLKAERAKPEADQKLPVYECNTEEGLKYILPVYGTGLWGPIWGYMSLNDDMNTIYGAVFAHQGETPGLGAEIATKAFQKQFVGKTIFNTDGTLVSITVAKSSETAPAEHKVDAISGGTITSKGLQAMLLTDFTSYKAFFNKKKQ